MIGFTLQFRNIILVVADGLKPIAKIRRPAGTRRF